MQSNYHTSIQTHKKNLLVKPPHKCLRNGAWRFAILVFTITELNKYDIDINI